MKTFIAFAASLFAFSSFALDIEVSNPNAYRRQGVVETDGREVLKALGSTGCYATDMDGREVPTQLTADSQLLIFADVPARGKSIYKIYSSESMRHYPPQACGRIYPERDDDIAWENETGGYRVYGPATQAKGERGYGYDLFFKYAGDPVVEQLYAAQCSHENWRKVDSLRKIDTKLSKEFENSFTYHIDHGKGMDCYAVGPTLGAGIAAPLLADSTLAFPWCYKKAEIVDNGPLRFTLALEFEPRAIGGDSAVVERRLITLDAGALLNRCQVSYQGLSQPISIAAGFPLRDETPAVADLSGVVAYSDPTQGKENGRAYLGIVAPEGFSSTSGAQKHVLGVAEMAPDATFDYQWGFVWDRNQPGITFDSWVEMLHQQAHAKPLKASILK